MTRPCNIEPSIKKIRGISTFPIRRISIEQTLSKVEHELSSNKAKWETYLSRRKEDRDFARAEARRIKEIRAIVKKELEEQFQKDSSN